MGVVGFVLVVVVFVCTEPRARRAQEAKTAVGKEGDNNKETWREQKGKKRLCSVSCGYFGCLCFCEIWLHHIR